jgi:multidrug efflux pump
MISRFFIDRPIFATVLSVIITLTGFIALYYLPVAQYPRITPPGVSISISYPGASAQVVADTVGAPIEQQVNGVDGMLYMSSQSGNDGSYSLTVTFDVGTDLNTALVMVQNRVALAMPQLPNSVQNQGITIRKKTPDILMIVNFYSPDNRYDDIYLSNYATINVKDELLRVEGVSDINYQGQRDYSIRVWLDPQKMAAWNITATDVAAAVRNQNVDAPAGRIGQPPIAPGQAFQLPLDMLGRLHDPEEFGNIVVKVGGNPPQYSPTGLLINANQSGATGKATTNGVLQGTTPTTSGSSSGSSGSSGSSSSSSSSSTDTSSSGTTGGATSTGGGTTSGGSNSGGGGTTGGAGSPGGGLTGNSLTDITTGGASAGGTTGSNSLSGGALSSVQSTSASGLVHLRDVAHIELGAQNYNQSCTFDGRPSVGLSVYQLPGTNALDVSDRVHAKMEELKAKFPDGIDYAVGYDTTPFIRESVNDVMMTLLEAVVIVGLVVLFFLQDWRAMILPMIDVPVSLIGTCVVMAALGFSLNNVSLFGLVLTIGIVVDDAIVVLENIERQIAKGFDPRTATIKAMEEVTGPIVAVGVVLCAVFLPCAFIKGITGQFFRQFAVTIAVSTVISAINAITMTPSRAVLIFKGADGGGETHKHTPQALPWWIFGIVAGLMTVWLIPKLPLGKLHLPPSLPDEDAPHMSGLMLWSIRGAYFVPGLLVGGLIGWLIIKPVNAALGWFFRGFNHSFDQVAHAYGWTVGKLLRVNIAVLVAYGVLAILSVVVFKQAPIGFIPQQDQGRLIVNVQLPDSSSLERSKEAAAAVEKIARETPGVAHTVSISGLSFLLQANSPNFASMFIVLDPFSKRQSRELSDTAIMARLRKEWSKKVPEAQVTVFGASPIPGLGVAGGYKIIIEDRGDLGLANLQNRTDDLIRKLKEQPGLNSTTTQFRSNTPQLFLDIDRTKAASMGVSLDDVNQTLDIFQGSLYVNSYNDFGRHWQVTLQADADVRSRPENISLYQVRNQAGQMVPLGTLVRVREIGGPISITRYNLYTSAAINGNIQTGTSTGDAIKAINKTAADSLPLSMKTEWTEVMYMQLLAGNTAIFVFTLAVACVFLALAGLYESWTLPLAVILVVPLCLLCSVAGVLITHRDVNIFVQIGLVVLVALACKNAILIVEFARQLHREGASRYDATKEASRLRLRPILMTSFAFIFGVIPMVIASGAGAEMRRSLGIAVFSGMLGVTLFGIFLTPVFFYVLQGLGETSIFRYAWFRWLASCLLGAVLGLVVGFSLSQVGIGEQLLAGWGKRLGLVYLPMGPIIGVVAGVVTVVAVLSIHQRISGRSNGSVDHTEG